MAEDCRSGEIVPQSGVYTIRHDRVHADLPREVIVIIGRRFPTCRHCKGSGLNWPMPPGTSPKSTIFKRRKRGFRNRDTGP